MAPAAGGLEGQRDAEEDGTSTLYAGFEIGV